VVENSSNYVRTAPTIRVLSPISGRGLFLGSGEEWRRERRTVAPAFALRAIRILALQVAVAAEALITDLTAVRTRRIDLFPLLRRRALEIIGSAMFSLGMKRYGEEMRQLLLGYSSRLGRPTLLDFLFPLEIPTPHDIRRRAFRRHWIDLIGQIVAERQRKTDDRPQRDFFELLVTGHSPHGASAERLADEIATIVVAGHETTAAALFWSLYLIASTPEEQEPVAAEVALLDVSPDGAVDALLQLVRTRAVVDEALRLYPPALVIVRQVLADDLVDSIRVPVESPVLIAPWILHRHHRTWNAPETSNPTHLLAKARRTAYS
jgi:cytochrome P450